MSEQEDDNRLAEMVKAHGLLVIRRAELEKEINEAAAVIASVGAAMKIQDGNVTNPGHLTNLLVKLPGAAVSADQIRGLIAEYSQVMGKLVSIRSQLSPYGLGSKS